MIFPLGAFLSLTLSGSISPGPNNIMCMTLGQHYGFRKTLPYIAGIVTGYTLMLCGLALSYSFISQYIPLIDMILGIFGPLYLCYLAWNILNYNSSSPKNNQIPENRFFITAMLFQFINPKALLFGLTLLSSFAFPYASNSFHTIAIILSMSFFTLCSLFIWAISGSILQTGLKKHEKAFNIIMAVLLLFCAISLSKLPALFTVLLG